MHVSDIPYEVVAQLIFSYAREESQQPFTNDHPVVADPLPKQPMHMHLPALMWVASTYQYNRCWMVLLSHRTHSLEGKVVIFDTTLADAGNPPLTGR